MQHGFVPPASFQKALVRLVFAVQAAEPVLLVGPTCYKTLLVETWATIMGVQNDLLRCNLTKENEAGDLLGSMAPYVLKVYLSLIHGFMDWTPIVSCMPARTQIPEYVIVGAGFPFLKLSLKC